VLLWNSSSSSSREQQAHGVPHSGWRVPRCFMKCVSQTGARLMLPFSSGRTTIFNPSFLSSTRRLKCQPASAHQRAFDAFEDNSVKCNTIQTEFVERHFMQSYKSANKMFKRLSKKLVLSIHLTRKLCYRKDYCAMRVTAQSDNTHMVCC